MTKLLKSCYVSIVVLIIFSISITSVFAAPPSIVELINSQKEQQKDLALPDDPQSNPLTENHSVTPALSSYATDETNKELGVSQNDIRSDKINKLLALLDKWYEKKARERVKKDRQKITSEKIPDLEGFDIFANRSSFGKPKPISVLLIESKIQAEIQQISKTPIKPTYTPISTLLAESAGNTQNNISMTISPTPTPSKLHYTIALLGDSMIDTLGPELPQLRSLIEKEYPSLMFTLLNYGQGATDLESGLYRLTHETEYLGKKFKPLLDYKPDILVIESFAYNHWSGEKYDLDRQWLTIAKMIDTVKIVSEETEIILAAAIAPDPKTFGDGVLNWPNHLKWQSGQITKAYLQNIVNFATSQDFPLADAYYPSMGSDGSGLSKYINQSDHIHPSGEGGWLFSQKIVEAIKSNNLIK